MNDIKIITIGICMILSYFQVFIWFRRIENPLKRVIVTLVLGFILIFFIPRSEIILATYFIARLFYRLLKSKKTTSKREKVIKIERNNPEYIYLESEKGTIDIANPYRGILIQGGAGSGKSKSLFYPIIQQIISNDYSGVMYDFKSPELSELAYSYYTENNKTNFAFLNFKDVSNSARVNPLSPEYLTKQAIAFEMATVLVNNLLPESIKKKDYWTRSSISVIAGTIWYLKNNHPKFCTLPHMIALILSFPSSLLIELLSNDMETAGMISSLKEAYEMKAEKQIAGVVGTIKNALAQLNIPEVFYLLSEDSTSLDVNDPHKPVFLSIGNDSSLTNTYAPIISLIISVCSRLMNQPGKHKSAIILDEAPTLYIPGFEQIPATARSNKVITVFGLQDYSQMVDRYGSDKAQVMISNLGNQFYGRTVNERSADMIVKLFGKHDVTYNTVSNSSGSSSGGFLSDHYSASNNKSISQSIQQRERVNISDIKNLSPGTFYGIIADGFTKELIGTNLNQIKSTYKKIEGVSPLTDTKETFKQIYDDVSSLQGGNDTITDFKIQLT